MGRIFTNRNREIRSGFKILLFIISYTILVGLSTDILIRLIIRKVAKKASGVQIYLEAQNYLMNSQVGLALSKLVETIVLFITVFILLKGLENRSLKDIGFNSIKKNVKGLLLGLVLGAISMTVIFTILLSSNNIILSNSLVNPNFSSSILLGILLFILVAISEEVMCRGYILNTLNQMRKPWVSSILSSAIFAALHLANPNVKILGILNIFLVGILFSYMYIRTKSLWMPIGYHFTWNYFQGNIFGFPVSGQTQSNGMYVIKGVRENIFTGGAFGPEAGILSTIVIIVSIFLVWVLTE